MKNTIHTNLIFSIPTEMKTQIDYYFKDIFTAKNLEKIYFLVYKINKSGTYQLHKKNHSAMLSVKDGILTKMINGLLDLEIIKLVGNYFAGERSKCYQVNFQYDYKLVQCYTVKYFEGEAKFPIWVSRYIADGGVVKANEYSKYIKVKTVNPKDIIIQQLQAKVAELEAQLNMVAPQPVPVAEPVNHTSIVADPIKSSTPAPVYTSSEFTIETEYWAKFAKVIISGSNVNQLTFNDECEIMSTSSNCVEVKTRLDDRTLTINDYIYLKKPVPSYINI